MLLLKKIPRSSLLKAWLLGVLNILGCFQNSQVREDNKIDSSAKIRPIDVDTSTAEKIGQEALDKFGYDEIIKLSEEAGFVAQKTNFNIQLASNGPVVATDFGRVFSQYAFTAAVTSQADSPLPGPADIAAVGIIVIGLVDAGLLDGYLIKSMGKLIVAAGEATIPATITTTAAAPDHPCSPCPDPRATCSRVDHVPPSRPHYPCPGDHTHNYTFIMNQNPRTCECYERPVDEIVCSIMPRYPETNPCP